MPLGLPFFYFPAQIKINKKKNGDNMSLYQTGGDLKTSAPNFKVCCLKNKQLKWR